jgi:hypothetical protein
LSSFIPPKSFFEISALPWGHASLLPGKWQLQCGAALAGFLLNQLIRKSLAVSTVLPTCSASAASKIKTQSKPLPASPETVVYFSSIHLDIYRHCGGSLSLGCVLQNSHTQPEHEMNIRVNPRPHHPNR